jgi:redox-sensitive bicupin YhaK (pirin superfamily)
MDQMGEVDYAPGEPKGTPWHPHRGFETFTYLTEGRFVHQDSNGGDGVIEPGGTQYMTAGQGILHIETPPEELVVTGGLFHGVQLWINLPARLKFIAPQYQDLQSQDIVELTTHDATSSIRILAGTLAGHAGPGISHTPLTITHITMPPGTRAEIPWPREFNAVAYALAGSGTVGPHAAPFSTGHTALLGSGDAITMTAAPKSTLEVFLIGGVPLREPVTHYGPFVMNSEAEIRNAFADYHAGRLGTVPAGAIQPHQPTTTV